MKTKYWILATLAVMLIIIPFLNTGMGQDPEDPVDEPIEEYEYEEEILPILRTAKEYGSLDTFLLLLRKCGLNEELNGDGPYTLFIPDDSAFADLKPEIWEKLNADGDYLKAIISQHIVIGHEIEFGEESRTFTIKVQSGDEISAEVTEESVRLDHSWIIDEWIECTNGVIHVIDSVLLPLKGKQKG
ncbi:MAG: fasciclin domain-containing protein [Candidatus Zixiibacteriota bacterium]